MVTFEALNALYGDCLLLRYRDDQGQDRLWVIDGGPKAGMVAGKPLNVWSDVLLPRLRQVSAARPVVVDLGMVSHIDDDHINGLEALTKSLVDELPHPGDVQFRRFWFNSFAKLVDDEAAQASLAAIGAPAPGAHASLGEGGEAVLESVPQGERLAAYLGQLRLDGNAPLNGFVSAQNTQPEQIIDGARVTILGPLKKRLDRLRRAWEAAMAITDKKARTAALLDLFASPADLDRSVPNLSSIVVLVEVGGKRILLTGDARGDDIVSAWNELGIADEKKDLDVLKVPHHGSLANNPRVFVEFFKPRHFVFSADGHYDNPDAAIVEGVVSIHHGRDVTLHFTNADVTWSNPHRLERGERTAANLTELIEAMREAYPGPWKANFRKAGELSVEISL